MTDPYIWADTDMAEAYLAGYQSAEAAWSPGTEPDTTLVILADEFGDWITDYETEVRPA